MASGELVPSSIRTIEADAPRDRITRPRTGAKPDPITTVGRPTIGGDTGRQPRIIVRRIESATCCMHASSCRPSCVSIPVSSFQADRIRVRNHATAAIRIDRFPSDARGLHTIRATSRTFTRRNHDTSAKKRRRHRCDTPQHGNSCRAVPQSFVNQDVCCMVKVRERRINCATRPETAADITKRRGEKP